MSERTWCLIILFAIGCIVIANGRGPVQNFGCGFASSVILLLAVEQLMRKARDAG